MTTAVQATSSTKAKTGTGTPAGTAKKSSGVDLAALIASAQAAGLGGTTAQGPTYTRQDAEAAVQSIYQQILGRNAVGAERTKAINLYLNQAKETAAAGRQEAVLGMIQSTPEYKIQQENKYLDAIYNAVAKDVRKAQA